MISKNHKVGDILWVMYGHDNYPYETIEQARITRLEKGYIYFCELNNIFGYSIGKPYDDEHTGFMWDNVADIPDCYKRMIVR